MHDAWYRLAMLLTLAAGFWEGPMAIVFRVFTDRGPTVLTAANYLPEPWCYVAAAGAAGVTVAVLAVLDARRPSAAG